VEWVAPQEYMVRTASSGQGMMCAAAPYYATMPSASLW
jgi:hypothetical protein